MSAAFPGLWLAGGAVNFTRVALWAHAAKVDPLFRYNVERLSPTALAITDYLFWPTALIFGATPFLAFHTFWVGFLVMAGATAVEMIFIAPALVFIVGPAIGLAGAVKYGWLLQTISLLACIMAFASAWGME